jgi:hypothetical protein
MSTNSIFKNIELSTKDEAKKFVKAVQSSIKNNEQYTSYTVAYTEKCKHQTGWYSRVETFWSKVLGIRGIRIYCCSVCGDILQGKKLKEFESKRKGDI